MATRGPLLLLHMLLACPSYLLAENVALHKTALQHGTSEQHRAVLAVDGHRGQDADQLCAITNSYDPQVFFAGVVGVRPAWWTVDLSSASDGLFFFIQRVTVYPTHQLRAAIRDSTIKAGIDRDVGSQQECAQISESRTVITKQCNPIPHIRYVSIVSSREVALGLCEVEVTGYPEKVFARPLLVVPTVLVVGVTSVRVQPGGPGPGPGPASYQTLYTAMTGDVAEQFGPRIIAGETHGEIQALSPGITYEVRLLQLEGDGQIARAISAPAYISLPLRPEPPRRPTTPVLIAVSKTSARIRFVGVPGVQLYKLEVAGRGAPGPPLEVASVPGQAEYSVLLPSLQAATSYTVTVTPYSLRGRRQVRGVPLPALSFTTAGTTTIVESITMVGTKVGAKTLLPSTPPQRTVTPAPASTHEPASTIPSSCLMGNGSECIAVPVTGRTASWVTPTAAGAGGLLLLLVVAISVFCGCRARRHKAADTAQLEAEAGTYEDDCGIQPPQYANTLPSSAGDDECGAESEAPPDVPARDDTSTAPPSETELHEEIDTLYSKIGKGPA